MSVFPVDMITVNLSSGEFVVRFTDPTTGKCIWSENRHVPVGYESNTWVQYKDRLHWAPDNRVKLTFLDDSLFEVN
jgi:hypothetical protein